MLLALTVISSVVAIAMTVVAWRLATDASRRSEARVAALAADIYSHGDAVAAPRGRTADALEREPLSTPEPARISPRALAAVAAIAVLAVAIAATAVMASGSRTKARVASTSSHAAPAAGPAAAAEPAAAPAGEHPTALELIALVHERAGSNLIVKGLIRNHPPHHAGAPIVAIITAYGRDGNFVASGRGEVAAVPTGGDSSFAVAVPEGAGAGRFRVSFSSGDAIVPHVDRRK